MNNGNYTGNQEVIQAKTTTFVMLRHFKLIWAASLMLLCGCSTQVAHQLVSLECSQPGYGPAINCTIQTEAGCVGDKYMWRYSLGSEDLCKSGYSNYQCKWDNQTFVSLIFTEEVRCTAYRVSIRMSCGMATSLFTVEHCNNARPTVQPVIPPTNGPPDFPVATVSAVIVGLLVVLGIVFVIVCKIMRNRKIL